MPGWMRRPKRARAFRQLRCPMQRPRDWGRIGSALVMCLGALVGGAVVSVVLAIWAANIDPGKPRWARTPAPGANDAQSWGVTVTGYDLVTKAYLVRQGPLPPGGAARPEDSFSSLPGADWRDLVRRIQARRPEADEITLTGYGWPLNCLAWQYWYARPARRAQPSEESHLALWRLPGVSRPIAVPTRVLWRNLAADSGAFGAPLLLLGLAIGPFRRYRRRRAGLCPDCAYDLLHDLKAGCPECGWNRATPEPHVPT